MKRLATIMALLLMLSSIPVRAQEPDMQVIRCTCYIVEGVTSSGQQTREGIISSKPEWRGDVMALYTMDDKFIGYYEVLDTGNGHDTDGDGIGDSIKNGKSIDVWMPSLDEAHKWISKYGDYVKMVRIEAKG